MRHHVESSKEQPKPITAKEENPLNTTSLVKLNVRSEFLSPKARVSLVAAITTLYLADAYFQPKPVVVQGQSMHPTLHQDDRMLIAKHFPINRFDIVVFSEPGTNESFVIKRVVGLPGETIDYKNGKLYVNDAEVKEPEHFGRVSTFTKVKIPEGKVYVLGDNRNNSSDSRIYGPVPKSDVKKGNPRTLPKTK